MKNFVQPGDVITVPAPAAVTSGAGVLVDTLFGIAAYSAASGDPVEVKMTGVFTLPKATGALTVGAAVYWDATNSNITTTSSGNTLVGKAVVAAASGDATATVRLNGA